MTTSSVAAATPTDRDRVLGSLVAAFVADPAFRYFFPDSASYPRYASAFFGVLFDRRVAHGTVWTADGGASVAMWDPPQADSGKVGGTTSGDDVESEDDLLAASLPAGALARVRAYHDAVHAALPSGPFWYLGVLGTHPDHAGRRLGRMVMTAGLRRATDDRLPAVLETTNPNNVDVYRRAGFEVVQEIDAAPLRIWIMQRDPG